VVASREELTAAQGDKVLGLFAKEHMSYDQDRNRDRDRDREPSLVEMTAKAIDILEKKSDNEAGLLYYYIKASD